MSGGTIAVMVSLVCVIVVKVAVLIKNWNKP